MKKWLNTNKRIIIFFLILTMITFTLIYSQLNFISQPEMLQQLSNYVETGEITSSLSKYAILMLIGLLFFGIWAIVFTILIWKMFFPTKKSVKEAFLYDNYKFIYNLPKEIKKGLNKYE